MREKTEKMMEELGCKAPRITKEMIDAEIESVDYKTIRLAGQLMMYCGIRLKSGFVQVGNPSTCIDERNWRDEIGREISYANAYEGLWKLFAFSKLDELKQN